MTFREPFPPKLIPSPSLICLWFGIKVCLDWSDCVIVMLMVMESNYWSAINGLVFFSCYVMSLIVSIVNDNYNYLMGTKLAQFSSLLRKQ